MHQQEDIELLCPKHGEKMLSISLTETGENQMFCLKCLTQKQIPIQQLTKQLTDLRQIPPSSQKRLGQLKKLFLDIKEQINQGIDNIIKIINDSINLMNQNIKQETELLIQSMQQLNLKQVNQFITELKKQQLQQEDIFIKKDESLRNQTIQQYQYLIEQLNKQIKEGTIWKDKIDQNINKEIVVQCTPIYIKESEQVQQQLNQYQLFKQEEGIYSLTMAMNKDQKILINGLHQDIQIWDFNSDGTIKLKQTKNGHEYTINCLCFSQSGYWFMSGSWDQSIRIWEKENDDYWICQQILEDAHQYRIYGIVMNNDEDQFISCGDDQTKKVWIKEKNGIHWKSIQTLTEHTYGVTHLSLNVDCNLLASSSGLDELRIWEKNKDQSWKLKQVIDYPDAYHARIKFIDNNELIATTREQGRILRYIQNNNGVFELKSELNLNEIGEEDTSGFPIFHNKEIGLMMVRLSKEFTYIIRRLDNGELIIHQVLNGDYRAGYMIKDGKYIILANYKTKSLDILK